MRDRRSKFVELANKRVNRAIKDLRLIGNLSNRAAYEFGEEDSRKIIKTLQREVEALRQRFSGTTEEADKVFSLWILASSNAANS
jgi:hypothetical protein